MVDEPQDANNRKVQEFEQTIVVLSNCTDSEANPVVDEQGAVGRPDREKLTSVNFPVTNILYERGKLS